MRTAIAVFMGLVVGFGLLAIGAGWYGPIAGFAVTFAVLNVSG